MRDLRQYMYYWTKCPDKYDWVVVYRYHYNGKTSSHNSEDYFESGVNKCSTFERADKLIRNHANNMWKTAYLLSRDSYNKLIDDYKDGTLKSNFNIEEYVKMTNLPATVSNDLKDKPVFMAWNMTRGGIIAVAASREEVTTKAESHVRENPTHRIVILAPVEMLYQPINITKETLNV